MDFPILILAGGLGTRLGPNVSKLPKYMVDICGDPFAYWQLKFLKDQGFHEVYLLVGHMASVIEDYVRDGRNFGLNVQYSADGPVQIGTGGAVKKAIAKFNLENFFLIYGDSYLPIQCEKFERHFKKKKPKALVSIYENHGQYDQANILFKGGAIQKYEKNSVSTDMTYIDYGLSIFKSEVFLQKDYPENFDLSTLMSDLADEKELDHYIVKERFYEIGSIEGLNEFRTLIGEKK